jgi:hypothetical protein
MLPKGDDLKSWERSLAHNSCYRSEGLNYERSRKRIYSLRQKYHRSGGSRKKKQEILSEVQELLDCHRKHAVRLMKKREPGWKYGGRKRGRKSKYGEPEFLKALHLVRRTMEFRNAEVMRENMAEWLPFIEKHRGEFSLEIRHKLLTISAATMKRYFRRMREQAGKGLSTTRPGSMLRTEVPVCIEAFWESGRPGKMATDTVAHCGVSTQGEYVVSLDAVCPVTHWTAQEACWGKGQSGILQASQQIEKRLPFPLIGWHIDNGTEFMNHAFLRHYTQEPRRNGFSLTRSRAYHKNDNCHVEQKNWSVVRRYFGYDRLAFQELVPLINDLYRNELNLYLNHFCRTFKLEQKIAIKSRYRRIYGKPLSPYQRVLNSEHVSDDVKNQLIAQHKSLDPVLLKMQIEQKLRNIFSLFRKLSMTRSSASSA